MNKIDNHRREALPLYDVQELTLEEALLVMAAEKERFARAAPQPAGYRDARYATFADPLAATG